MKYVMQAVVLFLFFSLYAMNLLSQNIKFETITDEYYGLKVDDKYQKLENLNDPEVLDWMKFQNKNTRAILDNITNRQNIIDGQKELDQLKNISYTDLKVTINDYYFYLKRNPLENFSKLYYRIGISGKEMQLYSPDDFKKESKQAYLINFIQPNWNGSQIAISLNRNGIEFSEIIIIDTASKKIISGIIEQSKPSIGGITWLSDNSGIIYTRVSGTNHTATDATIDTKAVIYKIGDNPDSYKDFFSRIKNPEIEIAPEDFPLIFIDDPEDKYIVGAIAGSTPYFDAYYAPTGNLYVEKQDWKLLFSKNEKVSLYYQDNEEIIYLTSKDASNYKICKTSIKNPNFKNPKVLVPEKEDEVIKGFALTKNGLFYYTIKNGVQAKIYHYDGKVDKELKLPKPSGFMRLQSKGTASNYLAISIYGWINPMERFEYDINTNTFIRKELFPTTESNSNNDLVLEELLVPSHDGKEIPLSVFYKKGLKRDGSSRVLMRGYGAYGIPMKPNAHPIFSLWAQKGGIYAVAHVRGGNEKGDAWYKDGHKGTKPNTWKDFIACTEYLIRNNYTSPSKMCIWSGSAGGILLGRAITERPELYAAAIIDRGMMNMVRIENGVNGANSAKEFGSVKNYDGFKNLLEMDAFHHLKKGVKYPATMITMGMNDSRVPAWQSAKFYAKLQEMNGSDNPQLLKVLFNSGHGLKYSKEEEFDKTADAFAFFYWQTGHPDYQPVAE